MNWQDRIDALFDDLASDFEGDGVAGDVGDDFNGLEKGA